MKKIFVFLLFIFCLLNTSVYAGPPPSHHHPHAHHYPPPHYNSSGSESHPVYLVGVEKNVEEQKFPNCTKHFMTVEKTINSYSDGTRRVFYDITLHGTDGSVIASNCNSVSHVFHKNDHYFIVCKNSEGCALIDSEGKNVTKKTYSNIVELAPNRFLIRYDKKYGVIDINEKVIIPAKYQKFKQIGDKFFITKLNGYFGILDVNNNVLIKNDCEKITPFQDVILLKRYGKYGICDLEGKLIYQIKYDKIKKLGEYILIKKDKKYQVLDSYGKLIDKTAYKKIKLERNTLYGYIDKTWVEINNPGL